MQPPVLWVSDVQNRLCRLAKSLALPPAAPVLSLGRVWQKVCPLQHFSDEQGDSKVLICQHLYNQLTQLPVHPYFSASNDVVVDAYEHVLALSRADLFGGEVIVCLPRSVSHPRHAVARYLSGAKGVTTVSLVVASHIRFVPVRPVGVPLVYGHVDQK